MSHEGQAMNRIIREHYPVEALPADLREGMEPGATVRVTIEVEEAQRERDISLEDIFALRQPPYRTIEEITEDLRRQREEWDD